ncbi:conserved exported hypothetical protein [Sphingomonas sp. EC-HK361]|uniref:hypothetical protein n=1 Tax=Sphingomonas sp. EC-HK361 TaxID=2038397 RepID=UPI0012563120|nr:hypothetical protein [Sphingomonas sp. EC-HK361]VVT12863.1 conserved exported hypothetical protein [Sphingomonas sp. EC-HK361]
MLRLPRFSQVVAIAALSVSSAAISQATAPGNGSGSAPAATSPYGYADTADLVLAAPLVVDAAIRSATRIKGPEAANVAAGSARFYVEADVTALIRGASAIPPRIGYLVDLPLDPRGRAPKLKKLRVLLFARTVDGRPDQVQLVKPDAQRDWTPAAEAQVRGIVQATLASDAPPVVTGIGNAFHVAGSLPGEGETQIFLTTADNRPVSLSILRRPGEQPRWAVALSEIVDDAAAPPARDTLLWYRLACTLPPALPDRSTASLAPGDASAAQDDYRFVLDRLGPCGRTTGAPAVSPAR